MKNKTTKRLFAAVMALTFALSGTVLTPATASAAASKTVTVKTQKQLDAALKDKKVTSIVIKTSKNVTLKIKDGNYGKKSLTVAAPKATVSNYGDFKKISVNDGKAFVDRGEGNNIVVKDTNSLKLTTGKQSFDTKITVSAKGGKISIVNNGSVDAINVKGKSTVTVSGNAKETPTITNDASGAKIVTAMNANVVLNKAATLTVKAGASLDSLTAKADSTITIAAGATVKDVSIAGNASRIDLTVNGTVGSVTVDAKAEVSVAGTTTESVAITNNAEGASIQAAVKTDVTLNANASVSLDKGAEGSAVKAGSADVKPVVENKTDDKVSITDSTGKETSVESGKGTTTTTPDSGAASGGTSGGGGYNPPGNEDSGNTGSQTVTITPTITMMDGATVLKPGVILKAGASNSANANVTYRYSWVCGEENVGTEETYTVSKWDSGDTITLRVTAVISGKEVSASKTTGIVKSVAHQDETFSPANIPFGVPANEAANFLKGMIRLADECGYTFGAKIAWASEDYNGNVAGTYTFTGTIALPNENWVWASDDQSTVKVTVTVLPKEALSFRYDSYTAPEGAEAAVVYNQAHANVSSGIHSYDCFVSGNTLKLKKYAKNETEHQWVGVNVTILDFAPMEGKALQYSENGTDWTDAGTGIVTAMDEKNTVTVWLAVDTFRKTPDTKVVSFRYGTDGASTPVTFQFSEEYLEMKGVSFKEGEAVSEVTAGTYDSEIKSMAQLVNEGTLPDTLLFTDADGEQYELGIVWDIYEKYAEASGTYIAWVEFADGIPAYLADGIRMPEVKVIVKQCKLTAVTGTAGDLQAGVEGNVTAVKNLGLLDTITCKGEDDRDHILYLDWYYPDEYDENPVAGVYNFEACVLNSSRNWSYDVTEIRSKLPVIKVIIKAAPLKENDVTVSADMITVNAKEGYEYACSVDDGSTGVPNDHWQANGEFRVKPDTSYKLFVRAAGKQETVSEAFVVKTDEAPADPEEPDKPSEISASRADVKLVENPKYVREVGYSGYDKNELVTSDYPVNGVYSITGHTFVNFVSDEHAFDEMIKGETESIQSRYREGFFLPMTFELPDASLKDKVVVKAVNTDSYVTVTGIEGTTVTLLARLITQSLSDYVRFSVDFDGDGTAYEECVYGISSTKGSVITANCEIISNENWSLGVPDGVTNDKNDTDGKAYLNYKANSLSTDSAYSELQFSKYDDRTVKVTGRIAPSDCTESRELTIFTTLPAEGIAAIGMYHKYTVNNNNNMTYGKVEFSKTSAESDSSPLKGLWNIDNDKLITAMTFDITGFDENGSPCIATKNTDVTLDLWKYNPDGTIYTYAMNRVHVSLNKDTFRIAPKKPVLAEKTSSSVRIHAVEGLEYTCSTTGATPDDSAVWQTQGIFTGLQADTTYFIFARVKATGNAHASAVSEALEVKTEV